MKTTITLITILISLLCFSQENEGELKIIRKTEIHNYHETDDFKSMNKFQLITLYKKRVAFLARHIPYIGYSPDAGFPLEVTGVEVNRKNKKTVKDDADMLELFLMGNNRFHRDMLPYTDKTDIIKAILFLEGLVKQIKTYNDFD